MGSADLILARGARRWDGGAERQLHSPGEIMAGIPVDRPWQRARIRRCDGLTRATTRSVGIASIFALHLQSRGEEATELGAAPEPVFDATQGAQLRAIF
jgi:hypothetical protein